MLRHGLHEHHYPKKPTICHFFGFNWNSEHRNKSTARGKKSNNCGIENHFAKVCRKPKDPSSYPKPKPRVNNVEKDDQTDDVNQILAVFDPDLESNFSLDEMNHQYLQHILQLL